MKPATPATRHTHVLRVYLAADGWRWRLVAMNGKTVADSAEAYARKRNAEKAAASLAAAVIRLEVQDTPPPKPPRRVKGKFAPVGKGKPTKLRLRISPVLGSQ